MQYLLQIIFFLSITSISLQDEKSGRQFFRPQVELNKRIDISELVLPQSATTTLNKRKLLLPIISESYASTNYQGGSRKDKDAVIHSTDDLEILYKPEDDLMSSNEKEISESTTTRKTTTTRKITTTRKTTSESPKEVKEKDFVSVVKTKISNKNDENNNGYSVSVEHVPAHDDLNAPKILAQPPSKIVKVVIPNEESFIENDGYYSPPQYNPSDTYQPGYQTIEEKTENIGGSPIEFHEDRPPFKPSNLGPDYYPLGKPPLSSIQPFRLPPRRPPVEESTSSSLFNFFNFFSSSRQRPPPNQRIRQRPLIIQVPEGQQSPQFTNGPKSELISSSLDNDPLAMTSQPVIGLSQVPASRKQSPFIGKNGGLVPPSLPDTSQNNFLNSFQDRSKPNSERPPHRQFNNLQSGFPHRRHPNPSFNSANNDQTGFVSQISALLKRYLSSTEQNKLNTRNKLKSEGKIISEADLNTENELITSRLKESEETTIKTEVESSTTQSKEKEFKASLPKTNSEWYILNNDGTQRVIESTSEKKENVNRQFINEEDSLFDENTEIAKATGALLRTFGDFEPSHFS